MGVSFEALSAAIAAEMWWSDFGYWVLAIGLAGDIAVLVIPKHRDRLEKIISGIFIVVIIIGVTIEHNADTRIAVLVSQQETAARLEIAKLKAPRIIKPTDKATLIAKLRPYAGNEFWIIVQKGEIDVDTEQQNLGGQLLEIFSSAGWRKENHWSRLDNTKTDPEFRPVSDRGCAIIFAIEAKSVALGKVVVDSLKEADIECQSLPDTEMKFGHIDFEIGLR